LALARNLQALLPLPIVWHRVLLGRVTILLLLLLLLLVVVLAVVVG
jgi:hypothetical protein